MKGKAVENSKYSVGNVGVFFYNCVWFGITLESVHMLSVCILSLSILYPHQAYIRSRKKLIS